MTFGVRGWVPSRIIRRASIQDGEHIERRHRARVALELRGRYLTPEGAEYDCETVDFSTKGVRFKTSAPLLPTLGDNIIAHVRDLGCLRGPVVRRMRGGFVIDIVATERKLQQLSQKLTWLTSEAATDRRLFSRVAIEGAMIPVGRADGRSEVAPIIDVSTGGIAFHTGFAFSIGERLEIGEQTGVIVRLFDGGAAAKFV